MKRIGYGVIVALLLGCWISAWSQSASKVITIGVDYFYPPFVYSTDIGFDIGLMRAICAKKHLSCRFVSEPFESLLTDLKRPQGRFDIAVGAISITEKRTKDYAFVGPYYHSTMSFLAKKRLEGHIGPKELATKKIGVLEDSTFYYYLKQVFGSDANLKVYTVTDDMLQALSDGDVDVISLDTPVAFYWQHKSNCTLSIIGEAIQLPGDQGYGIMVRKTDRVLRVTLEQGFQEVRADPYFSTLIESYFNSQILDCRAKGKR